MNIDRNLAKALRESENAITIMDTLINHYMSKYGMAHDRAIKEIRKDALDARIEE